MLLMLSLALAERLVKLSQASYKIAAGAVEPGLKTDTLEGGTFWIKSQI